MVNRLASLVIVAFLSACAAPQTYSDTSNAEERKAYVACAVTRAFLNEEHDAPPNEVAELAVLQCAGEREAVYTKLIVENAGKPFAARFVEAYMDELHRTMLDHIALRLSQARARDRGSKRT